MTEEEREKVTRAEAKVAELLKLYPDLTAGDITYVRETGEVLLRDGYGVHG